MKLIYTIIKVIILLLFLLLAVINTDSVAFHYLPGQKADLPLIVVLFGAFVIGIVFGMLPCSADFWRCAAKTTACVPKSKNTRI